MPIVTEGFSGLRRYAVFSFVEDPDWKNRKKIPSTVARKFNKCPLISASEAAAKLPLTELFHMKRLQSLEKPSQYPYIDVTFFSTYNGCPAIYSLIEEEDCVNIFDNKIPVEKACYEELQLVDPKRDMVQTPIDANDPITEFQTTGVCVNEDKKEKETAEEKKLRGYIIIAYRTMEDMYNREFVSSWKTWTGVRYICMQLPRQLGLRRISFYRQLANTSAFTYVLVIEISNLLVYAAETLNLMDKIKLRLCGYVGVFKESEFKLDQITAKNLGLATDFDNPKNKGTPSISVIRMESRDELELRKCNSMDSTNLIEFIEPAEETNKNSEQKGELVQVEEDNAKQKKNAKKESKKVSVLKPMQLKSKTASIASEEADETSDTISLLPKAGNRLKERMGALAHKFGPSAHPKPKQNKQKEGPIGSADSSRKSSGESMPSRKTSSASLLQAKIARAAGKSASKLRHLSPRSSKESSASPTQRRGDISDTGSAPNLAPSPIAPPPPSMSSSYLKDPLMEKASNVSDSSILSMGSMDTKPTASRDPSVDFQHLLNLKSQDSSLERNQHETESILTEDDGTRATAPVPFPSPSRFIGHGRIYNPNVVAAVPPMIQATNPLCDAPTTVPPFQIRPFNYSSPAYRRQSAWLTDGYRQHIQQPEEHHRHNVVSDLPSARDQLAPKYESIFKRSGGQEGWTPRPGLPPPPDFASIAANYNQRYNSPVYTRDEWKSGTNLCEPTEAAIIDQDLENQNTMAYVDRLNRHKGEFASSQSTASSGDSTRTGSIERNYNSGRLRRMSSINQPSIKFHQPRVVGSLSDLRFINPEEEEAASQRRRRSQLETGSNAETWPDHPDAVQRNRSGTLNGNEAAATLESVTQSVKKRSLRRKRREENQESTNLPMELARIIFTNTSERPPRSQRRRALPRTPSGSEITRGLRRSARSPDPPRRPKTTFGHILWP